MPNGPVQPTPIDYFEWLAAPNETFARHRAEHWWAPFRGSNMSEVLEYHAVRELLGDDGHLRSSLGDFTAEVMRSNPNIDPGHSAAMQETSSRALINLEGEEHHRLRALVSRTFTPRSVAVLAPRLLEVADSLARKLLPGDDFMSGFARELPSTALCLLLGIPLDHHERFAAWIDVLEVQLSPEDLRRLDADGAMRVRESFGELRAYCRDLIAERRAKPAGDLVSRLAADTDGVDDNVILQLLTDLIFAGNDTTRKGLGSMVMALSECPHAWEAVAAEPAQAVPVVEEVLRLHSPAPGPTRQACARFAYREATFAAGEPTALSIWSANRDESFWGSDANEFKPERENAGQHLSFGHGVHFCLGASLAREELRAALIALSRQIRDLHLLEPPTMHAVGGTYGPARMRITFERR